MSEWILVTAGLFLTGFFLGAYPGAGAGASSSTSGTKAAQRQSRERAGPAR